MNGIRWFGGKTPTKAGVSLVQSLFSPLFRTAQPVEPLAPAPATILSHFDSGADASWTASLDRGDGLPPFLLSINMVAGSCSAVKFAARAGRDCGDSLRAEL
jgi:hypothetical protein